jgi:hypothetical protein
VFALVFQPLTAVVTAPYNLVPHIRRAIMGPVRAWRRVVRLGAGSKPPAPSGKTFDKKHANQQTA